MTTFGDHLHSGLYEDYIQNYWEAQTHEDLITIKSFDEGSSKTCLFNDDIDRFLISTEQQINQMRSRMLNDHQRARNITNNISVQSSFRSLQRIAPKFQEFSMLLEKKRVYYQNLKEKLDRLRDTRQALNIARKNSFDEKCRSFFERRAEQAQIQQNKQANCDQQHRSNAFGLQMHSNQQIDPKNCTNFK